MSRVSIIFCLCIFILISGTTFAQEIPIEVGSDDTFCGGGAFDGTNFCVMVLGDNASKYSITAQFISSTGSLVGSRISLGHLGSNPFLAFDGTNYLAVWGDMFPRMASGDTNGIGNLYGQFISPTGALVGTSFTIVTGVNIKWGQGRGTITFQDSTYFLTYCKGGNHVDHLYGQRISRSGSLVGGPFQISQGYAREIAYAFDGTNYLVAWCKVGYPYMDTEIDGQFVSPSGTLVGSNFVIDDGPYASDDGVSMEFDGSRYWVGFHEQAADTTGRWNLMGRFVSTTGVTAERFTICDSSKSPVYPAGAFDGSHYLFTWIEFSGMPSVRGRFFTATGIPVDTAFTIFNSLQGKFPVGGVGAYLDGQFLVSATRVNQDLAEGDIYMKFVPGSSTGISDKGTGSTPDKYALFQNYPNPFNPSTMIRYTLTGNGNRESGIGNGGSRIEKTTLIVYDVLGRQVATLVDEVKAPGTYQVRFDGSGLSSGIYFYRLQNGSFVETKKLTLIR